LVVLTLTTKSLSRSKAMTEPTVEEIASVIDPAVWKNAGWRARMAYDTDRDKAPSLRKASDILTLINARAEPGWRPTHRHVKRGTDYEVIGAASLQASRAVGEAAILTIYRDAKGRLWARPEVEFDDGRFELLPAPPDGSSGR
jgi:hypothetical protein